MKELFVIGKVGGAPGLVTFSDRDYLKFSLAVNEGKGDNKKTTWINCYIAGRKDHLNNLKQFFTKGQGITIKGNFVTKVYNEKVQIDLYADKFSLV